MWSIERQGDIRRGGGVCGNKRKQRWGKAEQKLKIIADCYERSPDLMRETCMNVKWGCVFILWRETFLSVFLFSSRLSLLIDALFFIAIDLFTES